MSFNAGEIITLQLGNYANYIGTHWWNIQESNFIYPGENIETEINHDVMFRAGKSLNNQETYLPRLVVVDAACNFKSLAINHTALYDDFNQDVATLWDEETLNVQAEREDRNEFLQDLENQDEFYNGNAEELTEENKAYNLDVEAWSDFKRLIYHPRSVCAINNREYSNSWLQTRNNTKSSSVFEDFTENVRFFAEECDYLQGFNLLCDMQGGFGGFTDLCLQHLCDEYGTSKRKATHLTCPSLQPSQDTLDGKLDSYLSTVFSLNSVLEYSSYVVPMSLRSTLFSKTHREMPNTKCNISSDYDTSAVLAACYEAAMMPTRSLNEQMTLGDIEQSLVAGGTNKLLSLKGSFPCQYFLKNKVPTVDGQLTSLTPCFSTHDPMAQVFGQMTSLVGTSTVLGAEAVNFHYKYASGHTLEDTSFVRKFKNPLKVRTPFPDILNSNVDLEGRSGSKDAASYDERCKNQSAVVCAQLSSCRQTGKLCREVLDFSKKTSMLMRMRSRADGEEERETHEQMVERMEGMKNDCSEFSSEDSDFSDD